MPCVWAIRPNWLKNTITVLIEADATNVDDLENLIKKTMEVLGGKFDFILHSIGMSPNVRKDRHYSDLDYNYLEKTLDISAVSFHKVLQTARKLDAINEWGSVVALSYMAAQRTFYGYNDMADAKALLESIARSFGYIYGRETQCQGQYHFPVTYHDDSRKRCERDEPLTSTLPNACHPWEMPRLMNVPTTASPFFRTSPEK